MAIELNQPATAFLQARDEENEFDLGWFTAKRELELCGHGTLAAAISCLKLATSNMDRPRHSIR